MNFSPCSGILIGGTGFGSLGVPSPTEFTALMMTWKYLAGRRPLTIIDLALGGTLLLNTFHGSLSTIPVKYNSIYM